MEFDETEMIELTLKPGHKVVKIRAETKAAILEYVWKHPGLNIRSVVRAVRNARNALIWEAYKKKEPEPITWHWASLSSTVSAMRNSMLIDGTWAGRSRCLTITNIGLYALFLYKKNYVSKCTDGNTTNNQPVPEEGK